ncbi:MAG: ABC transporter ATP-binding protein [Hydrogenophilus sp.]|nr:ABC transporter ATP-binding protein [Hydrogenophilus sp.]
MGLPDQLVVEVKGAVAGYGEEAVLKGIDCTVRSGEVVALMGGSGSGKTTLLRLLTGQLPLREGEVTVFGERIAGAKRETIQRLRRRLGMLFQQGALFTDLTVFENVAWPLREHTRLPERIVRDLVWLKLEAVGLRGAASLYPAELSGGMARRVALARAIALDPELLLFDEPFAGLDPISLATVGLLIRRLNDALGAASVVVTHDVQESLAIVDYVYVILAGRIVAAGRPEEIRASDDPFVRQFVRGEVDGPAPFHYPAPPLTRTLLEERA